MPDSVLVHVSVNERVCQGPSIILHVYEHGNLLHYPLARATQLFPHFYDSCPAARHHYPAHMTEKRYPHLIRAAAVQPGRSDPVQDEAARVLSRCSTREARATLTFDQCMEYGVLPLGLITFTDGELLSLAARNERDVELPKLLQFATGKRIRLIGGCSGRN